MSYCNLFLLKMQFKLKQRKKNDNSLNCVLNSTACVFTQLETIVLKVNVWFLQRNCAKLNDEI